MATVGAWFLCCVCGICVVLCVWVLALPGVMVCMSGCCLFLRV